MSDLPKPRQRQPNVCVRCGSRDCKVVHADDVVDFKGLTLEVDGLAETVCTTCQHRWTTDGQEADNLALLRRAFAARRDEIRARDGLLTGDEIERALFSLHLSKAAASAMFGGGPNAFHKYITGDVLQSAAMDRLLRLTVHFGKQALDFLRRAPEAPLRVHHSSQTAAFEEASVYFIDDLNMLRVSASQANTQPAQRIE